MGDHIMKKRMTKKDLKDLRQQHKDFNVRMKKTYQHDRMMSFDDYVKYVRGELVVKTRKKDLQMKRGYQRDVAEVPSLNATGRAHTSKNDSAKYTGNLVKGICQTHKSNAVPIINQEQAVQIAQMRRN
jgi:hypothetical protein